MKTQRSQEILKLEGIRKVYETKGNLFGRGRRQVVALNDLNLQISQGEIFGLVGESGSGKTTAGRLIVRLENPDGGRILLDGRDTGALRGADLKSLRRRVQMIFQDPYQSLNPQISILETIAEPLLIHRSTKRRDRLDKVREMMSRVGLSPPEDFLHRFPHQLSGGQRQRVAIARAMILEPELVVADEPTSMLDASISAQIFNILMGLRRDMNVTFLFITHSMAAARYLCDRIAVLYRGHLVEQGAADEIIHRPAHPYTQALIDAIPKFGDCSALKRYGTLLRVDSERAESAPGCPFYPRCSVAQRLRCSMSAPPLEFLSPDHLVACYFADVQRGEPIGGGTCYISP